MADIWKNSNRPQSEREAFEETDPFFLWAEEVWIQPCMAYMPKSSDPAVFYVSYSSTHYRPLPSYALPYIFIHSHYSHSFPVEVMERWTWLINAALGPCVGAL